MPTDSELTARDFDGVFPNRCVSVTPYPVLTFLLTCRYHCFVDCSAVQLM